MLRGLAVFYYMRVEYHTARELGEQCLALAKRLQEPALLLRAPLTLGQIFLFLGAYPLASRHLSEGRALAMARSPSPPVIRAVQDSRVTCGALLAPALWLLGYADAAQRHSAEAVTLAQELAHPFSLAEALIFAAVVGICLRNLAEVRTHTEVAMTLATDHGFPHWEAHAAIYQGWAVTMQEHSSEGIALIHHGQAVWRNIGGELARPWFLALLAEAHGHLEQTQAGLAVLEEALHIVELHGERHYESELYRLQGELLLQAQRRQHAAAVEGLFRQALDIARRQQARSLELRAAMSLSRLLRDRGRGAAARRLLAASYAWFTEGRHTADLQSARALLDVLA